MKTKLGLAGEGGARHLLFWCPGCDEVHGPTVEGPTLWSWNGDRETPTLAPSILVSYGDGRRCHSFLTGGRLQFLGDCTHKLAGQTVDLPDWPYDEGTFGGVERG